MSKQKNSKTEQFEIWDAGHYQTGNTTPPKSSPLVMALLVLVIFLGGMLSGMGIVNLRQLAQMQPTQPTQTVPILLDPNASGPQTDNSLLEALPTLPEGEFSLELTREDGETDENAPQAAQKSRVTVRISDRESCAGLVITKAGHILTYAHAVANAERILVDLPDGRVRRAALVGYDSFSDLAVICISAYGLAPARFSDGNELTPGCKVAAFCGNEVTGGTVFATESRLTIGEAQYPMLKTSAATGNVSGSLWGTNGQVVGIISPRISLFLHDSEEETAFVIPSITVKQIVDQLLNQGFVSGRPSLGARVEEVTPVHQNYWQLPEGLRITHSKNAALLDGDILVELTGKPVHTANDLYELLFACKVGQSCDAKVYRDGNFVAITLTLPEEGKD
jgi:S1-C subfamily serine protease